MVPNDESSKKFHCKYCDYSTSRNSQYQRHLSTDKHKILMNPNMKTQNTFFNCICGKTYKHSSTLCSHKKTCKMADKSVTNSENMTADKDLIMMLVKQNTELMEILKNGTNNNQSHNTNSLNKTFNLQFFLNETCKDAMNISEFIEVVKSKVDMMEIYQHGYVNGISKLFIDELKSMEVTERPLHCTDERRNTFYVHNNDAWKKDEDLKDTKKAISHVSQTNLQQCVDWSKNVPDEDSARDDHITKSISICKEACSGDDKNNEKIIKNISKEIVLNKQIISDILV